jgi:putative ABC transport system ATP-binding protein
MIEIKNITKTYNSGGNPFQALKGISFSIEKGEFVAIMGPSGSGKSTLMHIIGALDTPTSGTYFLDGKDVSTLSDDELANIRREKIGLSFSLLIFYTNNSFEKCRITTYLQWSFKRSREKKAKESLSQQG